MHLDVVKNTKRNIFYGFFNRGVTLVLPFATRTIIINRLGADYLGLDGLFSSILQVLNLTELGFGTAIVYSMYKPVANNDTKMMCALLAMYKKIYRVIGIIILAVGMLILPFLPYLIKGEHPDNVNIYILYIIYLINTVLGYMLFAYKSSILNAFQRDDIISKVNIVSKFFLYTFQSIVVLLFSNYYIYLIILPLSTMANNILLSIIVRKEFPEYICSGNVDSKTKSDIKIRVAGLMISRLCMVSRNAFDNIFISAFWGLTLAAIYNNYFYIISSITSLMQIISTALMGGIGNHVTINDVDKNMEEMLRLNYIYMLLGGWCSICLCFLFQPFMKLWMGEDYLFPMKSVSLFVIYFYSLKIGDTISIYINATGLWWKTRYRSVLEAVSNIILNYILGKRFGVNGVIIATIMTIIVFNFLWGSKIVFDNYFGKKNYKMYIFNHLKYALSTICVGGITYLVVNMFHGGAMFELLIRGAVCCIISPLLYVLIYRNTNIYKITKQWVFSKICIKR